MPTPTTNYSFDLPTPGGDDDVWGDLLNANWTALDAQLFDGTIGADTTGNAATATASTSAALAAQATALETSRTLTVGATGKTFDGTADVSWSLTEIGVLFADQAEAEAGTDNTKLMTPLRTKQSILENAPAPLQLTQEQAEDDEDDTFGQVSGERLHQQTRAALNVSGDPPMYACRAWANIDGSSSSPTIRAGGNIASVTRPSTGTYTITFDEPMPDANYAVQATAQRGDSFQDIHPFLLNPGSGGVSQTASGFTIRCVDKDAGVLSSVRVLSVAVFR